MLDCTLESHVGSQETLPLMQPHQKLMQLRLDIGSTILSEFIPLKQNFLPFDPAISWWSKNLPDPNLILKVSPSFLRSSPRLTKARTPGSLVTREAWRVSARIGFVTVSWCTLQTFKPSFCLRFDLLWKIDTQRRYAKSIEERTKRWSVKREQKQSEERKISVTSKDMMNKNKQMRYS